MPWPERKDYEHSTGITHNDKKAPLGEGGRFAALKSKLSKREGVTNPGALAAYIGRKKYGPAKMAKMAAKGRKNG